MIVTNQKQAVDETEAHKTFIFMFYFWKWFLFLHQ